MDTTPSSTDTKESTARQRGLALAALGIVFGDIGTSPLYMMRQAFSGTYGLQPELPDVLGVLSLTFWTITLIVSIKYAVFIMRADNRGEGGVLSLASLALRAGHSTPRRRAFILLLALSGLGLFYGDAVITPAISVLSAVEGLQVATDAFNPIILPLAAAILIGLFMLQSHGTEKVGRMFGPVMIVWFTVLAILGILEIVHEPQVLMALWPGYAIELFLNHPGVTFAALGAIILCVTGAETIYADMGHFGRGPVRIAWFYIVMPALVLNYFGQGALILADPKTVSSPFFLLGPEWLLYPLVVLSTCATAIASQAMISGVFSVTRQAIQLGYLPRMDIRHTSATEMGQIYIPRMNWMLMAAVLVVVFAFGNANNLGNAYGVAVFAVMCIDCILAAIVARWIWGWNRWLAFAVFGAFLSLDLLLLSSTLLKIPTGGWFTIAIAIVSLILFKVWNRGRETLVAKLYRDAMPIREFLEHWDRTTERVSGTAVFMTSNPAVVPTAFLHNLKHNHVVHERVVLLKVNVEDIPRVADAQRIEVEKLGKGFHQVIVHYGFMERPDVPRALELCRQFGLSFDLMQTTFFLGRETLIPARRSELRRWQAALFIGMQTTALSATRFFRIPANRVVEMGTQVEI